VTLTAPFAAISLRRDDLDAGRQPRRVSTGVTDTFTVEQIAIHFLDAKKLNVQVGEMETRT
jgi:hypothetical protein